MLFVLYCSCQFVLFIYTSPIHRKKERKRERKKITLVAHNKHSFPLYYQMKPQNQRKRESQRKSERASEQEKAFACSLCSTLNYLLTRTEAQTQNTGTLVYTCALTICQSHLLTNTVAVKPLLPVWSLIAQLISECMVTQLPGTLHFPCFATHPNFTETERKREKRGEREHVCGVRLTL